MKRTELLFAAILVPIDWAMLVLSAVVAYTLRFQESVTHIQPAIYTIPFSQFFGFACVTSALWLLIFALSSAYGIRANRKITEEVRRVFFSCSTGVLIIIVLFFFNRDLFSSRFIILATYVCSLIFVTLGRLIVLGVQRKLMQRGIGVKNIVLIGEGHVAQLISNEIANVKRLGYTIIFQADSWTEEVRQHIAQLQPTRTVDAIMLAQTERDPERQKDVYAFCDEQHMTFLYAAALFDTQSSHMRIQPIAGVPVVEVLRTPLDGWGRIAKRLFDIVFSLCALSILLPIYLIIALCILIDSGWPIVFSRKDNNDRVMRVGQYGKAFWYFKFRTMKPKTDSLRYSKELQEKNIRSGSPLVKIVDDPRITRVGAFLRRYSLDELLEFILVLRGEMSVVGPRPHLPEEVAQYSRAARRVLNVKPGITGLAQVSGRSDLDFEDEVRLDTFYIEHWSLMLDMIIIIKTPFILFQKRRAL
ncbi:MAG: sugar transferase [Candidatus Kerfeldbacteria bacterium]|nr:sugar transferase [Candidatus Kerfeldbacteria bacterium]